MTLINVYFRFRFAFNPKLFLWSDGNYGGVARFTYSYRPSLAGLPAMPSWMKYKYSQRHSAGTTLKLIHTSGSMPMSLLYRFHIWCATKSRRSPGTGCGCHQQRHVWNWTPKIGCQCDLFQCWQICGQTQCQAQDWQPQPGRHFRCPQVLTEIFLLKLIISTIVYISGWEI